MATVFIVAWKCRNSVCWVNMLSMSTGLHIQSSLETVGWWNGVFGQEHKHFLILIWSERDPVSTLAASHNDLKSLYLSALERMSQTVIAVFYWTLSNSFECVPWWLEYLAAGASRWMTQRLPVLCGAICRVYTATPECFPVMAVAPSAVILASFSY